MLHMFARDEFQVEISALGAVGIPHVPEGDATRVKSALASVAPPGLQSSEPGNLIQSTIPV